MPGEVLVGTASWSDPGYVADWYPKRLPAAERLSWYAERFNLVEVNSSFYAIPQRRSVQRWCEQTPPGFVFDVKLHRLFSWHSTKPELLPPDLRPRAPIQAGRVKLTPSFERQLARRFLREIEPFAENEKLGALLLQFSPAFRPRTHRLEDLENLLECLQGSRLAIELRNRDWVLGDQLKATADFFRRHRLSWVAVDGPPGEHFMIMPVVDLVTNPDLAYLRCHGRNASGYVRGRTVAQRFDYFYNEPELREIAQRTVKLADQAATVHVIYNNNFSNYAPTNAAQFRQILAQEHPEISTGPAISAGPRYQPTELQLSGAPQHRARRLHGTGK